MHARSASLPDRSRPAPRRLGWLGPLLGLLVGGGCGPLEMANQAAVKTYRPSDFFADGRSARPLVEGTIAQGRLVSNEQFSTGFSGDKLIDAIPLKGFSGDDKDAEEVRRAVIVHGRNRFNIYCTPCHGYTGDGDGMIVRRGFPKPPSFHEERLVDAPSGHFYNVITKGYGAMYSYASRIPPADRWAIVTYIRALQMTRRAKIADVPAEDRGRLEEASTR